MWKILLAPVLIWQGYRVKRDTPRLSEAQGPRSGLHRGGPRLLRLLVLGDSAAAGAGVLQQASCLSHQIPNALASRYTVVWTLEAESGLTTENMADRLGKMPPGRYDVAVTSLGVNDVKAGVPVAEWMAHQKQLLALLREKFQIAQIIVTAVPPMEKFPALPWPLSRYLGDRSDLLNQALCQWLEFQDDCTFLKIDLPFDPGLMAEDGFHPGPELHRIWAEQVAGVVKPGLGTLL